MQDKVDAVLGTEESEIPVSFSDPFKCPKCGKTEFGKEEFYTIHRPYPIHADTRLRWAKDGTFAPPQLNIVRAYFICKSCGRLVKGDVVVGQLYPEQVKEGADTEDGGR